MNFSEKSKKTTSLGGLYIHIPYCLSKCNYCDFVSYPLEGHLSGYIEELKKEMDLRKKDFSTLEIDSIFFGGGTPSLLTPYQIGMLLEKIQKTYLIAKNCEITVEANPDTVNQSLLLQYNKLGINRISFGIQALQDSILQNIQRRHNVKQAVDAIMWAREAGFSSINCDFMIGLPGETDYSIANMIEQIAQLPITHISMYFLTVSRKTPIAKLLRTKQLIVPSDQHVIKHWSQMVEALRNMGFHHYEISNFAKTSYQCRHNLHYWNLDSWAAFGLSSTGFQMLEPCTKAYRYTNFSSFLQYTGALSLQKLPTGKSEKLTRKQIDFEKNMLHFRLLDVGIPIANISIQNRSILKDFFNHGWIGLLYQHPFLDPHTGFLYHSPRIVLTEKGVVLSNEIIARLLFN
jgi:oxygen-independent coproporphyrinogen-3 oxidase